MNLDSTRYRVADFSTAGSRPAATALLPHQSAPDMYEIPAENGQTASAINLSGKGVNANGAPGRRRPDAINFQRERGEVLRQKLLALAYHCSNTGKKFPCREAIAVALNCHVSTVWKHLGILRRDGKLTGLGSKTRIVV